MPKRRLDWRKRDWLWLIGYLIGILGLLIVLLFYDKENATKYFSLASSVASIILAVVAIIYAFISSSDTSNNLTDIMINIQRILSQTDRDVSLNKNSKEEVESALGKNANKSKLTLTRYFVTLATSDEFNLNKFAYCLDDYFNENVGKKFIDYSADTNWDMKGVLLESSLMLRGCFIIDEYISFDKAEQYFKEAVGTFMLSQGIKFKIISLKIGLYIK
jgi:hypothetical protein